MLWYIQIRHWSTGKNNDIYQQNPDIGNSVDDSALLKTNDDRQKCKILPLTATISHLDWITVRQVHITARSKSWWNSNCTESLGRFRSNRTRANLLAYKRSIRK